MSFQGGGNKNFKPGSGNNQNGPRRGLRGGHRGRGGSGRPIYIKNVEFLQN